MPELRMKIIASRWDTANDALRKIVAELDERSRAFAEYKPIHDATARVSLANKMLAHPARYHPEQIASTTNAVLDILDAKYGAPYVEFGKRGDWAWSVDMKAIADAMEAEELPLLNELPEGCFPREARYALIQDEMPGGEVSLVELIARSPDLFEFHFWWTEPEYLVFDDVGNGS